MRNFAKKFAKCEGKFLHFFAFFRETLLSLKTIIETRYQRPLIFQFRNSVRSNNLRLKYQRFTNIGIRKFQFVAKTQFFFNEINILKKNSHYIISLFLLKKCKICSEEVCLRNLQCLSQSQNQCRLVRGLIHQSTNKS